MAEWVCGGGCVSICPCVVCLCVGQYGCLCVCQLVSVSMVVSVSVFVSVCLSVGLSVCQSVCVVMTVGDFVVGGHWLAGWLGQGVGYARHNNSTPIE